MTDTEQPLLRTLKSRTWISRDAIDDSAGNPIPDMAADLVERAYAQAAEAGADITDWQIRFAPHETTAIEQMHSDREHLAWLAAGYDMVLRAHAVGGVEEDA